jgi:hypothetical protein
VSTVGTIVLYGLALVGALCILGSVGWFVFFWRTAASGTHVPAEPTPASEVVARHTGNVRVMWNEASPGDLYAAKAVADEIERARRAGVIRGNAS